MQAAAIADEVMFVEQRAGGSQGSSVWLVQLVLHRLCSNEQTLFHPFSLVGCQGCCRLSFLPSLAGRHRRYAHGSVSCSWWQWQTPISRVCPASLAAWIGSLTAQSYGFSKPPSSSPLSPSARHRGCVRGWQPTRDQRHILEHQWAGGDQA